MTSCPNCGAVNAEDARFCNQCGTPLVDDGDTQPTLPGAVREEPPAETLVGHSGLGAAAVTAAGGGTPTAEVPVVEARALAERSVTYGRAPAAARPAAARPDTRAADLPVAPAPARGAAGPPGMGVCPVNLRAKGVRGGCPA
ncbi:MAG: zinc-ribbon domain-containing protein, partial [Sandaracinaceae bacterium]